MSEKANAADVNACPMCGAPIEANARTCRSCGENLPGAHLGPETTMKLTPLQRMTLTAYLEYGDSPPTWGKLIRRAWRRHLILVGTGVITVIVLLLLGGVEAVVGFAAFMAGAILGEIGMYRRFLHLWPALARVLNRKRIDELLAEDGRDGDILSSRESSGPG